MLIRMAFRNVLRRPVQSSISVLALTLGLALTVFGFNFHLGNWDVIVNSTLQSVSGHVVVQAEGFQESKDNDLLVADSKEVADLLAGVAPDGKVVRRATLTGLLQSPTNNVGVGVQGIEQDVEAEFSKMVDMIEHGEWLRSDDRFHALIGEGLARKLGVELDDKVVLMVGVGGEYESRPLRVRGVFKSGSHQMDGFLAVMPLAGMQQMLPGVEDPASQVALLLDGVSAHEPFVGPAAEAMGERPVEVLGWPDAMPDLATSREMDIGFAFVIWPIMALIVSIGVLNTLLMSLFERSRELGVMLAIGMKPAQLFRLLLMEGFILGMVGATFGLLLGLLLTYPVATDGVVIPNMADAMPVQNVAFDGVFYARYLPFADVAWAAFFVFLSTLVSAWPAWRAASTDPIDSLRGA